MCPLQIYTKKNSDLNRIGRGSQTAFLIHRASFLAANGHDAHGHVSHICDNRRCFNPDHLADETAQVNNSRKNCTGPIFCSVHHHLIVDLCQHLPQCIRPERTNIFCCLTIKESDPMGWAFSQQSRSSPPGSQQLATTMTARSSSEYEGAEFLEQAVREGIL